VDRYVRASVCHRFPLIASRIAARNTHLAPLELATGFELPNMPRRRSYLNSAGTADPRAARFEHDLEVATLVAEIRKPFNVLAEGLLTENSRGDWTQLELFIGGVRDWDTGFHWRRTLLAGLSGQRAVIG
jgi:hypothetical protein